MEDIILTLTNEGADTLREFASSMKLAIENIVEETNKLIEVYNSLEDLGAHEDDFAELLENIKRVQEEARDALDVLPRKMEATADKIDAYVASRPKI